MYDKDWAKVDINTLPNVKTELPGPKSKEYHARASKIMKGYSGQVKLFPVVFESGHGCTMKDIDGNEYIDFSSGIYVTNYGHCHPKVSESVAKYANQLMNCHDFTTEIKMKLLEKLADTTMGDLNAIQLYDSGTTAVEAGLRAARAATGKQEFISFWRDFHGKTMGSVSLAVSNPSQGLRAPGFFLAPRPDPYRPQMPVKNPNSGKEYIDFLENMYKNQTTQQVAAVVLEPIQGWGGTVIPPDDFIPLLSEWCKEKGILLFADEVLTCMGRTGKTFAMEHYGVTPDIMTLGKGFGNGFPVTAMCLSEKYSDALEKISASSSYGGNPMACAAALASLEIMEEENINEHVQHLEGLFLKKMEQMKAEHPIIGDVRGKGCLLGIELVKDKESKEPLDIAGKMVYQKAFQKGLAWIPAGHILRMSPPLIMEDDMAMKGMDIIDEAIYETEKELGY